MSTVVVYSLTSVTMELCSKLRDKRTQCDHSCHLIRHYVSEKGKVEWRFARDEERAYMHRRSHIVMIQ